jgi:hypothetical protein
MVVPAKALVTEPHTRPGTRLLRPSLRQCQLDTPAEVADFAWSQVHARRPVVGRVLDLGAGAGTFGIGGTFDSYTGYEIDPARLPPRPFKARGWRVINADAFDAGGQFDVVVGNPPYIRNQDITAAWRTRAASLIEHESGVVMDLRANLYVYFMWLALLRAKTSGLVAQIVPADWLVRPSARRFREFIKMKGWHVAAYVFDDARRFFPAVKTNLTLTIIDKHAQTPWTFHRVTNELTVTLEDKQPGGLTPFPVWRRRTSGLRAARGFSPGSQSVFVLTEDERLNNRISLSSVVPCVTSFRGLPSGLTTLSADVFQQHYVAADRKCWMLKTAHPNLSAPVRAWLADAPPSVRENATCAPRTPWHSYAMPKIPDILYSSGFRASPQFVVNQLGAINVGVVHGIFGATDPGALAAKLRAIDHVGSRFQHARHLLKIEVSQMNEFLDGLTKVQPSEVIR